MVSEVASIPVSVVYSSNKWTKFYATNVFQLNYVESEQQIMIVSLMAIKEGHVFSKYFYQGYYSILILNFNFNLCNSFNIVKWNTRNIIKTTIPL